jgi:FkbM family methyltransferase
MRYDYIDIGTSDFETSLEQLKEGETLILVEPLIHYLNKFPNKENIFKCPFALSDTDGILKMYFVSEEKIRQLGLPAWVRGCNSLGEMHPTLVNQLNLQSVMDCVNVPVLSVSNFFNLYQITEIGQLKIDTEGHDATILREVYQIQEIQSIPIQRIIFEYIWRKEELDDLIQKYQIKYDVKVFKIGDNVILNFGENI